MEINVEDNFTLLFDKNNNTAYKALQALQKECEESDRVYDNGKTVYKITAYDCKE